ncbi:hypothetical protein NL676_023768 [Syzygium grande]|nr:hypothetical protein NL676_023768 [Syzygium grande]
MEMSRDLVDGVLRLCSYDDIRGELASDTVIEASNAIEAIEPLAYNPEEDFRAMSHSRVEMNWRVNSRILEI